MKNSHTLRSRAAGQRLGQWMRPQRLFVLSALIFGTMMTLIVPPFQVPDERDHFLRAYQISEGQWVPTWRDNVGGGMLPASIGRAWLPFVDVRFNRATTSRSAIINALRIPLRPDERARYEFGNTSSYSPLVYLPQAMAIALGRILDWPPLGLIYLGRLANLCVWAGLGYCSLRIATRIGRPLLLLMLMPMSLFQAASVSPDAVTNGLAFLVTALVFQAAIEDGGRRNSFVGWGWMAAFVVSSAALSLTKAAYLPLAGLIFLVPARRFGGRGGFAAFLAMAAIANALPLLLWARQTPGLDMITYAAAPYVSARRQFEFLRGHPLALLQIPILSAQRDGLLVALSFVGRLGWLNIQLSPFFVFCYLAMLLLACRPALNEERYPHLWRWTVVITSVLALSVQAVLLLNDLFWTSVGGLRVDGLQGRYFIPIAPALLLLASAVGGYLPARFRSHRSESERNLITAVIILVSCLYTVTLLYLHYYVSVGVGLV